MSAAAVLCRQNIGWPSPATPQGSHVAGSGNEMNASSPRVLSFWVASIPPSGRKTYSGHRPNAQRKSVDFIIKLPVEIRILILSYLSPTDLCRCQQVSTSWYHVITREKYLMRRCQSHLKRQKIHHIKNQENYPVTPHVAVISSADRAVLGSLQNSGHSLSYSQAPLLTTLSSPMTDLLNFDRLQLKDDITPRSHEQSVLKPDVRRCLFPEEDNTIHPTIYRYSSITDAPLNVCGKENKKRIKRL